MASQEDIKHGLKRLFDQRSLRFYNTYGQQIQLTPEKQLAEWNLHFGDMDPISLKRALQGTCEHVTIAIKPGINQLEFHHTARKNTAVTQVSGNWSNHQISPDIEIRRIDVKGPQGTGLAKKVFGAIVDTVQQSFPNMNKLRVEAKGSVGGYAWAKFGFVPTAESWRELRKELRDRRDGIRDQLNEAEIKAIDHCINSQDPHAIWQLADMNKPAQLAPKPSIRFHYVHGADTVGKCLLLGSDWDGELDFKDSQAVTRFNEYLGKVGIERRIPQASEEIGR